MQWLGLNMQASDAVLLSYWTVQGSLNSIRDIIHLLGITSSGNERAVVKKSVVACTTG